MVTHVLGKQPGPSEYYSPCSAVLPALSANGCAYPPHWDSKVSEGRCQRNH